MPIGLTLISKGNKAQYSAQIMERLNPIDDPETLIVINELSELKITPPNIGLNQFDEKVEDVSSDDGNEETAGKFSY